MQDRVLSMVMWRQIESHSSKHQLDRALPRFGGGLISLLITHLYLVRQQEIDHRKQEEDIQLSFGKLVNAYVKVLGKEPGIPLYAREAAAELQAKLKTYNRNFDANERMLRAGTQAKKLIEEHPEDFS